MLKFQKGDEVILRGGDDDILYEIVGITLKSKVSVENGLLQFQLKSVEKHPFANGKFDYVEISAFEKELRHAY
ncbi:hypothetical protein [Bacillus cereus]|uniref:Uncharacterized protein n=1 Tax=Bacillus cereus HuA3-9 TaxID=1053205 RepID=R8CIE7_BACCE|nr:hypothetical protein [Bacillus cereus]EOO11310.1 hypothetical protein IGA_05573 [Bacillus cereus HuA3-9]